MTCSAMASRAAAGVEDRNGGLDYRVNYRANYRVGLCSRTGPAPASTGFSRLRRARLPAPHVEMLMGRVRVVGLGINQVQSAGGGGAEPANGISENTANREDKSKTETTKVNGKFIGLI